MKKIDRSKNKCLQACRSGICALFIIMMICSCKKNDSQVPVLSTYGVSEITGTTAICGGSITSDGGATVSVRGVCWSTESDPTINDNKTLDGMGIGNFTSTITNLNPLSNYYVRAYATNSAGTGYGNVVSFSTINLAIGQKYQGGVIAYILNSGDPGYDANVLHGLIAAPIDQSIAAKWACSGDTIIGANGTSIGTGNQNTIDIMTYCATPGIAARLCGDLVFDGYSDWYLPSKDELNKLYLNRVIIGGFASSVYWSSTEFDAENACVQYFDLGYQDNNPKSKSNYVRAVRFF